MERVPAENQKRRKKSQSDSIHTDDEMDEDDLALFHVVAEDLRVKSTVGWQNAVKSLTAALNHIEREESQRFLEYAFGRVVSIMLDQHSSKIGPVEKSCVTQTLAISIPLIVAQLKSGRYAQVLPILVMVFNKKRTFYKDLRTSAMMGSYWNKVGGAPEVRAQCIAAFCELKGFNLLLDTLEVIMKTLEVDDANESKEENAGTSMDLLDSDDIRILLQALLDFRTAVSDEVNSRLCTLIMTYFVRIPEPLLKRESTDAVGAVISIVRRFVDANVVSATDINALWLDLTLRYVQSSSLPLRLFGLEQISQIVNCARASRAYPPRYLVRNAGTQAVNGIYILKPDATSATYVLKKDDTGQIFTLFCCTMKSGLKWWFISEADKMQPGSDQDVDYYQHQSQFEEYLPPSTHWMPIGKGEAPPPELIPEPVRDDNEEGVDVNRFDHVLGAWVVEKEITETIFGDRIHREVVSRSAPLIKFLAETNKLSDHALETIWGSCLQKDRALVDEIHTLLVSTVPFLSDALLSSLIDQINESLAKKRLNKERITDTIAFLERLAAAAPGFFNEKAQVITDKLLRLLWSIQQTESGAATSSTSSHQLTRSLKDFFQGGLRSVHGEVLRKEFLTECLDVIKSSCSLQEFASSSDVGPMSDSSALELLKFLIDSYGVEMPVVIESLNREHELVRLLFEELAAFVNKSREKQVEGYLTAIGHRLELIHYIHLKCPMLELSIEQIKRLWLVLSSAPTERECCLAFFNHASYSRSSEEPAGLIGMLADGPQTSISPAFSSDARQFIFNELLCRQTDFSCLGPLGYQCFHSYFVGVNEETLGSTQEMLASVRIDSITGLDALWRVAFESPVTVAKPASDELLRVYRGVCDRGGEEAAALCVRDFLHRILEHLTTVQNANTDALRQVQQSTQLLNGFVDGLRQHQDESSHSVSAISTGVAHGRSGRGAIFKVKIIAQRIPGSTGGGGTSAQENTFRTLYTNVFANMTLAQLRKQLERLVGHPVQQTKLLCAGAALSGEQKTLADLRITETSEVRVLLFNSVVQRPLSPDADHAMELSREMTTSVGGLISQDAEYFEVLFRVLDVVAAHPAVHKSLWDLLNKLPTNTQLLSKLTRMGSKLNFAEPVSDRDGDAPMEVNASSDESEVKAEWLSLLGDSSQNKPIYILQIVDSLLLPSDSSRLDFAKSYKESFVSDGGFDAVLTYFLEADVRSSLFNEGAAVALRILRSCLFDSQSSDEYGDGESLETHSSGTGDASRVHVKQKDYVRLALKIAELVVAEYSPADKGTEHTVNESERILIDALKTVRSIVRIEHEAGGAYIKSESLGGDLVANILMKCPNEQVREQWLLSIQAVCHAASFGSDAGDKSSVVVVFERMIDSIRHIEDFSVPCDQYFRLLRFLVQEDQLTNYCGQLAREILKKIHSGFSAKFLASNDRSNEVLTGCLEFLRDVLVHQTGLRGELAREMVEVVYDDCLFTLPTVDRRRCPLCVSTETRRPAFKLLATAISSYSPIILDLQRRLTRLFTRTDGVQTAQQVRWGQESNIETRRNGEHVGLKNQGCSCYMNSFLQQIFMHPTLRYGLLSAQVSPRLTPVEPTKAEAEQNPARLVGCRIALECMNGRVYEATVTGYENTSRRHRVRYDDGNEAAFVLSEGRPGNENGRYAIMQTELSGMEATLEVLRQVQRTFCYLQDSEMRYFNPRALVDSCKCLNLEFSVYQQNDASEFCDKLLDRLETGLKSTPQGTKCLSHTLGGKLISQKLPQGCGHRYEREEPFIRLELQIRGKESIEESLASFVEGELMDGDNKVECELCGTKKAAVRRTCFGTLPNFLILHLKRFDLDYTTFETVKLNNRCSFPMTLNMKPYTKEGLEEREAATAEEVLGTFTEDETNTPERSNDLGDGDVDMKDEGRETPDPTTKAVDGDRAYEYRLKGILVHSGVAQGGHYYSFIYDHVSEKWFKYDDEDVSPFDPENIEAECFGGVQRRTWHGSSNSVEMEVFSNALMLFYEKVEPIDTEYAESLVQGASNGTGSPYEAEVWRANEVFLQNSYVLDVEFHEFLREMVQSKYLKDQPPTPPTENGDLPLQPILSTAEATSSVASDESIQTTLAQIGVEFVMSVLLHSREKHGIARWITVLAAKFAKYKGICVQYFDVLSSLPKQTEWTRSILFESPDSISRQSFVHLTSRALAAFEIHMKARGATDSDASVLSRFLDVLIDFLDQTPVLQQTHLEECFMLIRNFADGSRILRDSMRHRDMIARLVNCFLGERAPAALKEAFPSSHQYRVSNRYASPDFQHLLEAIIAILGFPRRSAEPLVNESNTHYPHRVTLSEKAELALTSVFEQYHNAERGTLSSEDLQKYLSVCMSCSITTPAVQQKAQGIMSKYGRQAAASPSSISLPSELELDGFLTYYTDAASAAAKNVYQDLRAHGFGEDLKRKEEVSQSVETSNGLNGLSELSRGSLLNEVFFDSALEEDAETVGDMLLRIVEGDLPASTLLLRSLLQCMASTETGWKGQPIVDTCSQMLQTLLSRDAGHQDEMIEMAMIHPEYGLLTTAESRERVRQRYANSNLVPLFVYRQIVALVDLHHKIPAVAAWLTAHRRHWEWMYEWLRLESLRPSLGGRLAVLYRESSKLETLCRLGEALSIPYREEERHYIVEGAGYEAVNGVYKSTPQLHDNCTIYTCAKEDIEYTLFRCSMPSKARRWYISYSPNKSLLGTVSDEDFYFVPCHIDDDSPPEGGWRVWTKNEKAQPPAPSVRLLMSTVASDSHAQQISAADSGFGGDMDCGEGDVDADADTVEYDDSEDEIRVSNERFQAVHLDNQDEGDRSQSPNTDDFM